MLPENSPNSSLAGLSAGIDNDDHIESFFDGISYQKGGAVLRMLRAWLTRRDDRGAVRPRLQRRALRHSSALEGSSSGDSRWRHRRRTLDDVDASGMAAEVRFKLHRLASAASGLVILAPLRCIPG